MKAYLSRIFLFFSDGARLTIRGTVFLRHAARKTRLQGGRAFRYGSFLRSAAATAKITPYSTPATGHTIQLRCQSIVMKL